jgi:hypothetical protein
MSQSTSSGKQQQEYVNWLDEITQSGGELNWLYAKNCSSEWCNGTRTAEAISQAVKNSTKVKVGICAEKKIFLN